MYSLDHIICFEACSVFTHVPACMFAESSKAILLYQSASDHFVTSIIRPGCYQPGRQLFGKDTHPSEKSALSWRTAELNINANGYQISLKSTSRFSSWSEQFRNVFTFDTFLHRAHGNMFNRKLNKGRSEYYIEDASVTGVLAFLNLANWSRLVHS